MCNIIILKPGQMPIKSEFKTMCWNNWHSYGLVTKFGDKLDITKKLPANGEIDPEEIWKLLDRDIEYERILHVRHNTAGATSLENCHPFDVYFNEAQKRQVVFMHNGTFYEFKSKKPSETGYSEIDDPDGPSDTKNYVDRVLTPILSRLNGDFEDSFVQRILEKFWPTGGNKGLLIGAGQVCVTYGDWKKKKDQNGNEFLSSNDDYFDQLKRGPEFERRKAIEDKKKNSLPANKNKKQEGGRTVVPLSEFRVGQKHDFYQLQGSLANIMSDWNIYDRKTAIALGYATHDEITDIYKKAGEKDCVGLMEWIFADYAQMYDEMIEIESDKKKGELVIAALKKELQKFQVEEKKVG